MSYLHFFAAAAWVYLAFSAVCTLAAKGWLKHRLRTIREPQAFDTADVAIALLLPTFFPLVWVLSSLFHLGGVGLAEACEAWFLQSGGVGRQLAFFSAAGALGLYQIYSLYEYWRTRHRIHAERPASEAAERVAGICEKHPSLRDFADRIRVVDCPEGICAVRGWFRPTVEVAECLVERWDDEALEAALLHEVAHISHNDTVRLATTTAARILNPISRWLGPEFRAWHLAREIRSDRAAIDAGTNPVHLADALVTAARSRTDAAAACPAARLCGMESTAFEVRVELLLHSDSTPEHRCPRIGAVPLATLSLVAVMFPHLVGGSLFQLHTVVERLLG